MGRLTELERDQLSPDQLVIYNDIIESRGGSIDGPFKAWLHSPELADRAQRLGAFCRYHTSLCARLSELAILITARHWRATVEWQIHAPIARQEGLSDAVIEALLADQSPKFEKDDEQAVYELATELYKTRRVSETCYLSAARSLGEKGVVELIGILGYYALVAMTLNTFEVALPGQPSSPFPDLPDSDTTIIDS